MPSDRTRIAVYGGCLCSAAYGLLKLAHALGSSLLLEHTPLPPALRDRVLDREPIFVTTHWLLAVAALLGVVIALTTLRPPTPSGHRHRLPRLILLVIAWAAGALMVARALGGLGYGVIGDLLVLTGIQTPPEPDQLGLADELARWDLALWSPFFLVWGLCWLGTAWGLTRRRTPPSAV